MEHLSITFPESLRIELDREAKKEHTKRSTLIQKAVRVYLELIKRREIADLLKRGYQEMAGESLQIMKEFSAIDKETWKYVD